MTSSVPHGPLSSAPSAGIIQFSCWSCEAQLTVPAHMAGVTGPCPMCGQTLASPATSTPLLSPPAVMPKPSYLAEPGIDSDPALGATPPRTEDSGMGYRRPLPPSLPAPEVKTKSGSGKVKYEAFFVIPFLMMGANFPAKLAGCVIGGLVFMLSSRFCAGTESLGKRIGITLGVFFAGIVAFFVVCETLELPVRGVQARAPSSSGGSVDARVAEIRAAVEERHPGVFSDEDLHAADVAVRNSGKRDMMSMAVMYAAVLKARAER